MIAATETCGGGAAAPTRVYVADLAAYNNGRLHGAWIDADQSAEDIQAAVSEMLAVSPEPFAEEWAIHDYEGFASLRLSEWESFERVAAIASGISEHGEAFAAWLSYDPSRDPVDISSFEDAYRGEWESMKAYAEDFADQCGWNDLVDKAECPYIDINIDSLARDLDIDLYSVESSHYTIYVFDPSV